MTANDNPGAWTEAMLERILRIDGRRLDELSLHERWRAMRALGAAFPERRASLAALDSIEAADLRRHGRRGAGGGRRFWTPEEDRLIRERYPHDDTADLAASLGRTRLAVFQRANRAGLRKSPAALRRLGERASEAGKPHRFPKGHTPWNKGLEGYVAGGRSHETRFKNGNTPEKWVPVGTEVRDGDGYLKRKVSDDRSVESRFNWRFVHRLVWEAANGPIPSGHAVVFVDGDRANVAIENLELITRGELAKRNHYSNLPPELVEVIFMAGWVKRKLREREEAEQDGRTAASGR